MYCFIDFYFNKYFVISSHHAKVSYMVVTQFRFDTLGILWYTHSTFLVRGACVYFLKLCELGVEY